MSKFVYFGLQRVIFFQKSIYFSQVFWKYMLHYIQKCIGTDSQTDDVTLNFVDFTIIFTYIEFQESILTKHTTQNWIFVKC